MTPPLSASSQTAPADVPPGADEVLVDNLRTRVTRRTLADGSSVIWKQAIGHDAVRRLQHEVAILERLAGVNGVAKLAAGLRTSDAIAFVDQGGETLAQALAAAPFPPAAAIRLAFELAQIVAAVHREGVIHKDINPSNLLLVGDERRPVLIDFNIANLVAEERPGFTHQSEIAGTLAYISPEQTGRTGRPVDQRADLYALGATLYEVATGEPPFKGTDALELIRDHLVREPLPPAQARPRTSKTFSDIILRLLEKEPDRRYQSAAGLANDLGLLLRQMASAQLVPFPLGERDFAARLLPPSRLLGRESEIAALNKALDAAARGVGCGVLVAGAPGVGKTALINELRPAVTARRGWFVSGKFDQCRRDAAASAVVQALRALGRLMLSEPEAELEALRPRLAAALQRNTGLVSSLMPEFALLLGERPEAESNDLLQSEQRLYQAGLDILRTLASAARPIVMVVDDLQWAATSSIGFFDTLLTDESLRGVLLVGAYREDEVDAAHPLTAALSRWSRLADPPVRLRLLNLGQGDLSALLGEMLRLPVERSASLAEAVGERTDGNPYDTVELINALRRDGALSLDEDGWRWDTTTIRRYVGQGEVVDLLMVRINALPAPSIGLMELMACLAGEVQIGILQAATGKSLAELEALLLPPLEDGLLVLEQGGPLRESNNVRFRHDRVQQAAYSRLDAVARQQMHLDLARRLAHHPDCAALAAEQYLPAAGSIEDPLECGRVARLFDNVAGESFFMNYAAAERFLTAGAKLLADSQAPDDQEVFVRIQAKRVVALYYLRNHEAMEVAFRIVEARSTNPMTLANCASTFSSSLFARGLMQDAMELVFNTVDRLRTPEDQDLKAAGTDEDWRGFCRWAGTLDVATEARKAPMALPRHLAQATLMGRSVALANICGPKALAKLLFETQRMWQKLGPCSELYPVLGMATSATVALHGDYRTGCSVARFGLDMATTNDSPAVRLGVRSTYVHYALHWAEPLHMALAHCTEVRDGMLQFGAPQGAAFAANALALALFETTQSLETVASELDAAHSLSVRAQNLQAGAVTLSQKQLVRALRGETSSTSTFDDADYGEAQEGGGLAAHPMLGAMFQVNRAVWAAIFNDTDALVRHSAAGFKLGHWQAVYRAITVHLTHALASTRQAQQTSPQDEAHARFLAEADRCLAWLSARAVEAPANFKHLVAWIEAERAWATRDVLDTSRRFELALDAVSRVQRPWHHALITERAARFQLEAGFARYGRHLMADAHRLYEAWGAAGKTKALHREFSFLTTVAPRKPSHGPTTGVSADAVDMVAILRASQALSSETSLHRLKSRVAEVLGAMTGATEVQVLLRDERLGWVLSPMQEHAAPIPIAECGELGLLPVSAFRYALRTLKTLLVEDAKQDDRFSQDPYVAALEHCSLLVAPILSHGEPRAILMLENRLTRGAFAADRLDAVTLIAGQLAVSLDNTLLYASLERKVADRTSELENLNRKLEVLSVTDALTGLPNRRRFNEALHDEWQRAMRTGQPIGLAMIDIDQFKLYNDHYGHLGGDDCLRRVATAIGEQLSRGSDLAARYGGEEFVLLLPDTALQGVQTVAERLRKAIHALNEPHAKADHQVVTVSIGVVSFVPSVGTTAEQHIELADAALYEAKKLGRNRVVPAQREGVVEPRESLRQKK
jgi:diguanylate cyclase (GGDEF)-like protein